MAMLYASTARDWANTFDDSLVAVQARLPGAGDMFVTDHGDAVARIAKAICRKLGVAEDEHDDILQEVYCCLLDPAFRRVDLDRGSAIAYMRGVILNAIDLAGRRRRHEYTARTASDDDLLEIADESWQQPFEHVEARLDLAKVLEYASPVMLRAAELMCDEGLSQREAANTIGVTECKLSREITRLATRMRLAA